MAGKLVTCISGTANPETATGSLTQLHHTILFYQPIRAIPSFTSRMRMSVYCTSVSVRRWKKADRHAAEVYSRPPWNWRQPTLVLLNELLPDINQLGYLLEPFGLNTFVIQGTPADTGQGK